MSPFWRNCTSPQLILLNDLFYSWTASLTQTCAEDRFSPTLSPPTPALPRPHHFPQKKRSGGGGGGGGGEGRRAARARFFLLSPKTPRSHALCFCFHVSQHGRRPIKTTKNNNNKKQNKKRRFTWLDLNGNGRFEGAEVEGNLALG